MPAGPPVPSASTKQTPLPSHWPPLFLKHPGTPSPQGLSGSRAFCPERCPSGVLTAPSPTSCRWRIPSRALDASHRPALSTPSQPRFCPQPCYHLTAVLGSLTVRGVSPVERRSTRAGTHLFTHRPAPARLARAGAREWVEGGIVLPFPKFGVPWAKHCSGPCLWNGEGDGICAQEIALSSETSAPPLPGCVARQGLTLRLSPGEDTPA